MLLVCYVQSVLGAITSAQQRLKLYNRVPTNGLVVYTGTVMTDDGKEKKVKRVARALLLISMTKAVLLWLCMSRRRSSFQAIFLHDGI